MVMTLDETLRALAAAGDFTHMSVIHHEDKWKATFAVARKFRQGYGEHASDPVQAALNAIENAPTTKGRAPKTTKPAIPVEEYVSVASLGESQPNDGLKKWFE